MAETSNAKPIWMRLDGGALIPADKDAQDRISRIKRDGLVMVQVRQPRNPRQHRMAWGLARIVWENTERYASPERVMDEIKVNLGHCDSFMLKIKGVGEVEQLMPRSIAFESMDQTEFDAFFESMIDYVASEMIPGIDPIALMAELRN